MYCANMPYYDESFIHHDNQNQRRNKRSYHVYKTNVDPLGFLEPNDMSQALDKRNIRNIKRTNRYKPETTTSHYVPILRSKTPDRLVSYYPKISAFDPKRLYDIGNNNVPSLTPCKSFDNLTLKQGKRVVVKDKIRNGKSLQDLVREESIKHYVSPAEDYLVSRKADFKNSYSVIEARLKPVQRRTSRSAAPGVGVYRKICADNGIEKQAKENEVCGEAGSGHRGSLRGANKLARRARSFKDDLLERISNMRSPAQPPHPPHLSSNIRSHSPLSPKPRSAGAKAGLPEENEITPAKELERLVKEVTFGLKHFSDVITKRKLEMLPDNGTIVFESIANIHRAIKPYCSRSPQLTSAASRLCSSLATLIRLCDDATAGGEGEGGEAALEALERASGVLRGVTAAVAEAQALAAQLMARPALKPRPPVVAQRNSLPDIPLTPKELSALGAGPGGPGGPAGGEGGSVRASHSSESVLEAPDVPPPKPARPDRPPNGKMESAPPLPPKRKSANDDSLLGLSVDRLSLQSRSSGSLDSMLNVSSDAHDSVHHDAFIAPPTSELIGICSCNNLNDARSSVESHESHSNNIHGHSNHNRFSNESGFVSVGHAEISTEHSFVSTFSSHHYSSHTDSTFESTEYVTEVKCTVQSVEGLVNVYTNTGADKLASIPSAASEAPPELPAKTRRALRTDVQQYFPNVEIRKTPPFSALEARPHTLAEHHHQRPPPLPLKKKHIMAYMEMFGNCSHTLGGLPSLAALPALPAHDDPAPDMFRHSIHTYNLTSSQQSSSGSVSLGHQQVSRTMASSLTVQHLSTPPLSGSDDSVSMKTSSRSSPVPPEPPALLTALPPALPPALSPALPPALPPKMSKSKQLMSSSSELLPSSPRPSSHDGSLADESVLNNTSSDEMYVSLSSPRKFPVEEEEPERLEPDQRSEGSTEQAPSKDNDDTGDSDPDDIILQTEVSGWLSLKGANKEGPEVRGGHPDALIVLATKATKDFAYQEAFLATYRTWVSPADLVRKLVRRARHHCTRTHELRSTLGLLTRVVADLTMGDLERTLMREIMEFIYWLVETEELPISKALRQILVDKQKLLHLQHTNNRYEYETPCYGSVSLRRDTLLDFKASDLAEQMTVLDSALFVRITTAEVLSWPRDQSEESSPNLTRFTEHFNKMSYWARSRILEQYEAREREKYAGKVLKVMKSLRKLNNFNSYLALVSALDCPPVRRLGWPRHVQDALRDHCALIDSSHSFRSYRQALADTQPPCIPYIGLVLQDLTFVHEGNPDLLPDGDVNFTKRLQQYNIMENMKRFHKEQYKFKKNERIQAMFNEFDDVLSEETMWQISETIKPRGGRSRNASAPSPPAAT